jgi:hypothetical protein
MTVHRFRGIGWSVVAALALAGPAHAQTDTAAVAADTVRWTYDAVVRLHLAQSAYSENWSGGDRGALAWVLNTDITAQRPFPPHFHLKNMLQLAYGQTANQVRDPANPNALVWDRPEKSTDLILFESTGRFTYGGWADPYAGFRLESQFLDQSDPRGDLTFHPVKLTESVGLARMLYKTADAEVITRLGAALRQTFARTFVDPAGSATRSFTAQDGGAEWLTEATVPMLDKKLMYKGRLLVYQALFFSGSSDLEAFDAAAIAFDPTREPVADYWRSPDVSFQNAFTSKITEWLSVTLFAQIVYDKFDSATEIDPTLPVTEQIASIDRGIRKAGQFKETLGIGLSWALF